MWQSSILLCGIVWMNLNTSSHSALLVHQFCVKNITMLNTLCTRLTFSLKLFLAAWTEICSHSDREGMPKGVCTGGKGTLFDKLAGAFLAVADTLGRVYRFIGGVIWRGPCKYCRGIKIYIFKWCCYELFGPTLLWDWQRNISYGNTGCTDLEGQEVNMWYPFSTNLKSVKLFGYL